ncbi:tetratricopeptide repeat protein [Streptomonospora wellingtoniae]|uniref:Tetratricopeptide repeat protein n=1 Tax=Streptomonospora wellingtoniae TaxID=3075544 RepID=A0ABU2KTL0_9ACTN|nr:tetratricopeptide repeat protein [Streptomonospora sp. DSM 45055]MDT0302592.1 tetratricopeptide repeat protein [Streptomonospora sp. DSM 45055]
MSDNAAAVATVHGMLLQARDIHGGVHLHPPAPTGAFADVSLDAPRPPEPLRGRDDLLAELDAAPADGAERPVVLTGPGGIGKSAVAAALARRAADRGRDVFWVRAGAVAPALLEAAVEAGGARAEAQGLASSPRRAARWVWRHLDAAPRPWLLVLDNADRPEELDPDHRPGEGLGWLRTSPRGLVVVTTRIGDPALWEPALMREVGELAPDAAAAVLADRSGPVGATGARTLADRLGGIPLALTLAGGAAASHPALFADLGALRDHLSASVLRVDRLSRPRTHKGRRPRRSTLAGVWEASMELLDSAPHAPGLLRLLSVLGADGLEVPLRRLPLSLLRGGAGGTAVEPPDEPLDETALAAALNALAVHGLAALTSVGGERALRIHPLIGETTREGLGDRAATVARAVARLLEHQRDRDPAMEWAAHRALAEVCSAALGPDHPDTLGADVGRARQRLQRGDASGAAAELAGLARRAADALGADHPVRLRALHHRGDALIDLGRLDEADRLFRDLLAARTRAQGPDAPDADEERHQLAAVALRRQDWDTAAAELAAVVAHRKADPASDGQRLLFARVNLCYARLRRGERAAAESGFRRLIAESGVRDGTEDPAVTLARLFLAVSRMERGEAEAAEEGFADALRRGERRLGADHPELAEMRAVIDGARASGSAEGG